MGSIDKSWEFKRGSGCQRCAKTGYAGRMAVHELLEINHDLADALRDNDDVAFNEAARRQKTYKPLAISAFERALAGETTLSEVFRIATEVEDVRKNKVQGKSGKKDISDISI